MNGASKFYRILMLFQVYSGAVASFLFPPLFFAAGAGYLCSRFSWNRFWIAAAVLLGLFIGGYSAIHFLMKTEHISSLSSKKEKDGLYRLTDDEKRKGRDNAP